MRRRRLPPTRRPRRTRRRQLPRRRTSQRRRRQPHSHAPPPLSRRRRRRRRRSCSPRSRPQRRRSAQQARARRRSPVRRSVMSASPADPTVAETRRIRRGGAALPLLLAVALAFAAAPSSSGSAGVRKHPPRAVAVLYSAHTARSRPMRHSRVVQRVSMLRPLTGERTRLPVIGRRVDTRGRTWLRVLLPGRPNGHRGRIVKGATANGPPPWLLVVHPATRRVPVVRGRRASRHVRARL